MKITILSSSGYKDPKPNYGDCILIDTGKALVIYDCGSEEHAQRVMDYMTNTNYDQAIFILSHNDSDHFNGLPVLLDNNKISAIGTTLLLKYVDKILERIDDKRKTRESVKRQILDLYDNIKKLSGEPLYDVYENPPELPSGVEFVGPELDYMLDTVAKRLDGREGNTQDGETAVNATSLQVSVDIDGKKLLLCGDSSFSAIEDKLTAYKIIQLPHHGKVNQAEKIFEKTPVITTSYIVSDNTGDSNGGSDKLDTKGRRVKNTKDGFDISIEDSVSCNLHSLLITPLAGKTLGE